MKISNIISIFIISSLFTNTLHSKTNIHFEVFVDKNQDMIGKASLCKSNEVIKLIFSSKENKAIKCSVGEYIDQEWIFDTDNGLDVGKNCFVQSNYSENLMMRVKFEDTTTSDTIYVNGICVSQKK